ncbi:MAG: hypothetical protein ACI8QC_000667 [Planctomycetota bacterium]|jgi:hypothetical protein
MLVSVGQSRTWIGIALLLLLLAVGLWRALDSGGTAPLSPQSVLAPAPEAQPAEIELSPTDPNLRRSMVENETGEEPAEPDEHDEHDEESAAIEDPPEEEIIEESERSIAEWLTEYGLPTDTPVGHNLERFGPPDPLDLGNASLTVKLFNKHSGQPMAGTVVLWQLNAPANELWQAGDQDVAASYVPAKGYTFEGLAGGEYRPLVLTERFGAPEADALGVGGHTTLELFIEPPRPIPVRLKLPEGHEPVQILETFTQGEESHPRFWGVVPAWVQRRIVQPYVEVPETFVSMDGMGYGGSQVIWTELPWLENHDGCYDAGFLYEDQKGTTYTRELRVRVDGQRWPNAIMSHTGRKTGQALIHALKAP